MDTLSPNPTADYVLPEKPETRTVKQIYIRFRDGHTEVFRDPKTMAWGDGALTLSYENTKIIVFEANVLFVEESTFEETVPKKKDEPK